jgi:hypothetical protein
MSNEEQVLAQQLDSVFEELTKGMTEPEKNQFFNELNSAMEEEIDKMSKMNDDELTKYIEDAEKELQNLGPWPEKEQQPTTPPATPTEPTKPTEPVKEETKIPSRDMVPTIDEIAARLDSFNQKANQVVEMSTIFEKWGKKGKLHGWNPTMTWAVFKDKVDSLKKTLLTIKSLDPKTQKTKYLVDLTANEPLCNNINQFRTVLAKHEPNVQTPSFGLKKLSKSSKAAFVAVINDCLEALLALNLQTELDKIIAKYDPTAKKIKEAEEKAQQIATEAGKGRPVAPGAMKTTVKRGEEAGYYQFGVPNQRPDYQQYGPTHSYTPEQRAAFEEKGRGEDGSGSSSQDKEDGKNDGAKAGKEKKGAQPGHSSRKEDVKDTEDTKYIENMYRQFQSQVTDALEYMRENLTGLQAQARSTDPKTVQALKKNLEEAKNLVHSAYKSARNANDTIAKLEKGPHKEKWTKNFRSAWSQVHKEFMHWKDAAQKAAL